MKKTPRQRVVVIVGPTGSGKTDLAITLASEFSGILMNADSIQVYKNLDIISGKDLTSNKSILDKPDFNLVRKINSFDIGFYKIKNIPLYLTDILPPTKSFSAYNFSKLAAPLIKEVSLKNLPIVVGGTGLYIKSLIYKIDTLNIPPNKILRAKLSRLALAEIQAILARENPKKYKRLNESDINNSRRLIRTIEITFWRKKNKKGENKNILSDFTIKLIGLKAKRSFLKNKIDRRVDKRIKNGALREARGLFKNYGKLSSQVKKANGYKELFAYLLGKINYETAIMRWKNSEYRHAKNQMTWFARDKSIKWFDIEDKNYKERIAKEIENWLNSLEN